MRAYAAVLAVLALASTAAAFTEAQKKNIMDVVNHFDDAYGLHRKTWNDTLASNSQKTGAATGGVNEIHHLFPGTMAQVITPGIGLKKVQKSMAPFTPFQVAYFDWLCEVPKDPELEGKCPAANQVSCIRDVPGDTGHHDILTSKNYDQIGCSFTPSPKAKPSDCFQGLWICDLH